MLNVPMRNGKSSSASTKAVILVSSMLGKQKYKLTATLRLEALREELDSDLYR